MECVCLPEPNDEYLIVQCKWTQILPQSFDRFPRNATKNLTVRCVNSDSTSTLGVSTFRGFSELRVLTISASEHDFCV
ncbi:hypothetical protein M3Y94_00669100 [Aphelenchoides besseyi]|nr:hypothetical protein M3Y94_00669100 [Aphelenchoides besseyi]